MSVSNYDNVIDSRDVIERIEAEQYAEDWQYGTTLIRESYFTEYCRDLVADLGYLSDNLPPFIGDNIDWDGVADDLKMDYTEVDFDGVTYLVR